MSNSKRLFLCDWDDSYRKSLIEFLLHEDKRIDVIGDCQSYSECVKWFESNHADYLLITFPLDEVRFLILLDNLAKKIPSTKIIVITIFEEETMTPYYLKAGAYAHHRIEDGKNELLEKLGKP